jgi:organic radical activating enzyme
MNKKLIQITQHTNTLQLTWVMNNICTNHCDYCPPSLHSGKNHHYDWEIAKGFIDRLFKRYPKIHCSISGGEPTVSPFFPELVKMFYSAGHTVGITSNAGRSKRYLEEIAPYLSYICFSYHPSFEDPKFLEKSLACAKHTYVAVRIMMDSRYWNKSVEMYNKCVAEPDISVEVVRILPEMSDRHVGDDYSQEQLDWMANTYGVSEINSNYKINNPLWRDSSNSSTFYYDDGSIDLYGNSNNVILSRNNDFRGWACNIGLESLFIHWNGWVKKGNCLQGGNLFHLNDHTSHKLPDQAEICFQKICHCGTDIMISKVPVFDKDHTFITQNTFERIPKSKEEYKAAYEKYEKPKRRSIIKIIPGEI